MLKPALKPGYSKILVFDSVVTPQDAEVHATAFDLVMASFFGSKERSLENFSSLAKDSGLKVVNVWSGPAAPESVIEMELA